MILDHNSRLNLLIKLFIFCLTISIAPSFGQEIDKSFCRSELNKRIRAILKKDDGEILNDSFNVATLKLSYKMLEEGNNKTTLEDHIKKKIRKLDGRDKSRLMSKVKKLYRGFGQAKTNSQIQEILDGLDNHNYFPRSKRLSNKESSVIMLAYQLLDDDKAKMKINENDVAITWFMGQVAKQTDDHLNDSKVTNLLESSVKIAHIMGVFKETRALTQDEVIEEVEKNERKIKQKLDEVKNNFLSDYSSCLLIFGSEACLRREMNKSYQGALREILSEIGENEISKTKDNLKVKLSSGLTLNLRNSLIQRRDKASVALDGLIPKKITEDYPRGLNTPTVKIKGDAPSTCDGESFEGEIKNVKVHGYDWLRAIGMGKNGLNTGRASQFDPNKRIGKVFSKICPTIPLVPGWLYFKCAPYLKLFKYTVKKAEAKVCCDKQVVWEPYSNRFISFTGGIEAKVFMGLPDKIPYVVAQFGGLVGINLGFSVGGGGIPEGCGEKKCIQGTARVNLYGGLYLDLGVSSKKWGSNKGGSKNTLDSKGSDRVPSAIGGEAKIVWKPHATLRQCLYPENNIPPAELKSTVGKVWLQGTFYVGWIYSYDFYRPLVESDKKDTTDLPIF